MSIGGRQAATKAGVETVQPCAVDAAEGFRRTTLSALVLDDRIYERDPDGDAA